MRKKYKRWCVIARFSTGVEVLLRDFRLESDAYIFSRRTDAWDIYPNRNYEIVVERRKMEADDDSDFDSTL